MKINPQQLFQRGTDVRKYLSISYSDEDVNDILETYDIDEYELEQIIENYLYITLNIGRLPETIEVDTITYPIKTDDFLNDEEFWTQVNWQIAETVNGLQEELHTLGLEIERLSELIEGDKHG